MEIKRDVDEQSNDPFIAPRSILTSLKLLRHQKRSVKNNPVFQTIFCWLDDAIENTNSLLANFLLGVHQNVQDYIHW